MLSQDPTESPKGFAFAKSHIIGIAWRPKRVPCIFCLSDSSDTEMWNVRPAGLTAQGKDGLDGLREVSRILGGNFGLDSLNQAGERCKR